MKLKIAETSNLTFSCLICSMVDELIRIIHTNRFSTIPIKAMIVTEICLLKCLKNKKSRTMNAIDFVEHGDSDSESERYLRCKMNNTLLLKLK